MLGTALIFGKLLCKRENDDAFVSVIGKYPNKQLYLYNVNQWNKFFYQMILYINTYLNFNISLAFMDTVISPLFITGLIRLLFSVIV